MRQKIVPISRTVPPVLDSGDQMIKSGARQAFLLPFQRVILRDAADLRSLLLHLFKIDAAMLLYPGFRDGPLAAQFAAYIDLVKVSHEFRLTPLRGRRIVAFGFRTGQIQTLIENLSMDPIFRDYE